MVEMCLSQQGVDASIEAYFRWQDSDDYRVENLVIAVVRAALSGAVVRLSPPRLFDQLDEPNHGPKP